MNAHQRRSDRRRTLRALRAGEPMSPRIKRLYRTFEGYWLCEAPRSVGIVHVQRANVVLFPATTSALPLELLLNPGSGWSPRRFSWPCEQGDEIQVRIRRLYGHQRVQVSVAFSLDEFREQPLPLQVLCTLDVGQSDCEGRLTIPGQGLLCFLTGSVLPPKPTQEHFCAYLDRRGLTRWRSNEAGIAQDIYRQAEV